MSTEEEHPESYCHRCYGPNFSWAAASPLWNQVMRGGSIDGPWIYEEIVCPNCFIAMAEAIGVEPRVWRLTAADLNVELQTSIPDGRVWDEATFMWVQP